MDKLKVLVVDDENGIRSGIERTLRNFTVSFPFLEDDFSFEILEAETGEKAIEIISNSAIDIILLDNKLPGIQGIEVLEHINKTRYDAGVMMITSYASLDLAVKATTNGAYNFVPKPFTPQELKTAIENITKHLFLKRMTKEMMDVGKQLRYRFLSVLSHELKSPLNAIEGYLNIMQDKQVGDNIDDYQSMIDRSLIRVKGMRNLILDMLDLTKLEYNKKNRKLKQIDLVDVARLAIDTIKPLAIQRNVSINLHTDEHYPIIAETEEMEIIFNNLLSNAVKYNKEDGDIDCSIQKSEMNTIIKVKDTGIGMTENEVNSLFGEFVRIKNGKTRNISGSGLGLSILKQMVDMYQGNVEVSSTPDVGSTFTVIIPTSIK